MNIKLPRVSKKDFCLFGSNAQILLLHGFTGTPYDLKLLGLELNKLNYLVKAPLLFGHGKDSNELKKAKKQDWFYDAASAFKTFDTKSPKIIIGLSMGALLATLLAWKFKNKIQALILISPCFKLNLSAMLFIKAAQFGLISKNIGLKKLSGGSDIADPVAKKKCPSLKSMPLSGLLELNNLRKDACKIINKITCPLFAAFAKYDDVINLMGSKMVVKKARSKILVIKKYEHSKHIISLDFDRDKLINDIKNFLKKYV